jgi:glycine/D-amino acid oxidase-like deaminating enzyme/nitrite reductase/ring-hydroxylating ferredoxin subunit
MTSGEELPESLGTVSPWMLAQPPAYPPLAEDQSVDICVIGAGVAGLTTAFLLAEAGRAVLVLDDGPVGSGETGRTTAHLSNAVDDRYFTVERLHGERGAELCADSHTAAIDRIESIAAAEAIDCDFERVDGYLFLGPGDEPKLLMRELDAARAAGLTTVDLFDNAPVEGFATGPCLRFPRQAQLHPLKYLAGLARAIEKRGGRIRAGTRVDDVEDGAPATVRTTSGRTVRARSVVVATNTPVNDRFVIHTKQAAYRTYAIGARVPAGRVTHALFWDTCDPYHYIRLQTLDGEADELLIVGGEDHKTGQESDTIPERHARLEEWTRRHFPMITDVAFRWSGQVMEPVDRVAFIGRNPGDDHIFVATGDSGMGMTHGTIAGLLISDLILGKDNRWAPLYDPGRITLRSADEFLKENLNVAARYGEWLAPADVPSEDHIARGTGAVVRHGLSRVAVYRDADGALHRRSAVCPHLGCIVAWNPTEHSWDCPCHGSRFDPFGRVLNGPALTPLAEPDGK